MNNDRRKAITNLCTQLEELRGQIEGFKSSAEEIHGEEQEYFDKMPENIQQGSKGQIAETAANALQEVVSSLETIDSELEQAISNLETATQ